MWNNTFIQSNHQSKAPSIVALKYCVADDHASNGEKPKKIALFNCWLKASKLANMIGISKWAVRHVLTENLE